jgi:DNA-directed RNA polymerase specialized sigma24 family protein
MTDQFDDTQRIVFFESSHQESRELERAVMELPPRARAVLFEIRWTASSAAAVDDETYETVGKKLRIAPSTVGLLWFRAIEYLSGRLESVRRYQ